MPLLQARINEKDTEEMDSGHAAEELDALRKSIPTLISKLPTLLPRQDPRHGAALAEMTASLTSLLRPTTLVRYSILPERNWTHVLLGTATGSGRDGRECEAEANSLNSVREVFEYHSSLIDYIHTYVFPAARCTVLLTSRWSRTCIMSCFMGDKNPYGHHFLLPFRPPTSLATPNPFASHSEQYQWLGSGTFTFTHPMWIYPRS